MTVALKNVELAWECVECTCQTAISDRHRHEPGVRPGSGAPRNSTTRLASLSCSSDYTCRRSNLTSQRVEGHTHGIRSGARRPESKIRNRGALSSHSSQHLAFPSSLLLIQLPVNRLEFFVTFSRQSSVHEFGAQL